MKGIITIKHVLPYFVSGMDSECHPKSLSHVGSASLLPSSRCCLDPEAPKHKLTKPDKIHTNDNDNESTCCHPKHGHNGHHLQVCPHSKEKTKRDVTPMQRFKLSILKRFVLSGLKFTA